MIIEGTPPTDLDELCDDIAQVVLWFMENSEEDDPSSYEEAVNTLEAVSFEAPFRVVELWKNK